MNPQIIPQKLSQKLSQHVESMLDQLYAIGKQPEGGVYRSLYDDAWREAMTLAQGWMTERGLSTRMDAVGNLIGRIDGSTDGPVIATGSHIDTVRNGGRLDGALGVVGGIVALAYLHDTYGTPKQPLEVIITCEEEGSRFPNNFWGSTSIIGAATEEQTEVYRDVEGISLAQAMRQRGFEPTTLAQAKRSDLGCFLELHPEQGGTLEQDQIDIGVVTAITGITHLKVTVSGQANHAGTTPMRLRVDALAGAAEMILALEALAKTFGEPAVATVGKLDLHPYMTNVVPDEVVFTIDLRHADRATHLAMRKQIERDLPALAQARHLGIEISEITDHPAVPMASHVIQAVDDAAAERQISRRQMPSGAGHDAQIFAQICPAGMIFVPSIGGLSHTPDEATEPHHVAQGVAVLAGALYRLAY